jgi:uncharacterized membrane protein
MDLPFPGLKAMENIHPVFVHFPVVLLPLALVVQALTVWRRWADRSGQHVYQFGDSVQKEAAADPER